MYDTDEKIIKGATCEWLHEMWGPHPGCREFMDEPEAIVACGEPATRRITTEENGPDGVEIKTACFCDQHAAEVRAGARVPHSYFAVLWDELIPTVWYVSVYEASRSYGGPEEGGWWYDEGTLIQSHVCTNRAMAERLRERLRLQFPHTGKRSSVLGGEDWDVSIEREPGHDFPVHRPHYE